MLPFPATSTQARLTGRAKGLSTHELEPRAPAEALRVLVAGNKGSGEVRAARRLTEPQLIAEVAGSPL